MRIMEQKTMTVQCDTETHFNSSINLLSVWIRSFRPCQRGSFSPVMSVGLISVVVSRN